MFEDLEEENVDVMPDSPDRAIAWGIWSKSETTHLAPEEAWTILHQRYPDEARFLLLGVYAEMSENRRETLTRLEVGAVAKKEPQSASSFLAKVERILALSRVGDDALLSQARDLVTFGGTILAAARGDDAQRIAAIRERLGAEGAEEPKRDERDRAGLRLRRFEREVLKEIDERTQDGKALGVAVAAPPPPDPRDEWSRATADAAKPRRTYAATDRYARGELVVHPKFGVGVVTGLEPGRVVLLFESGTRKLVAG